MGTPDLPGDVEKHELTPGGEVSYFMTSPENERFRGWWRITSVDAPNALEFQDGFADQDGTPNDAMPTTTVRVRLTEHDGGTRMQLSSAFESLEQMEQLMNMGMAEGLEQSVGQMDALLAAGERARALRRLSPVSVPSRAPAPEAAVAGGSRPARR